VSGFTCLLFTVKSAPLCLMSLQKCLRRSSVDELRELQSSVESQSGLRTRPLWAGIARGKQPANEVSKREAASIPPRKSQVRGSRSSKSGPARTHRKLRRFTLPSEVIKRSLAWLTSIKNYMEMVVYIPARR
jgi:hypothetical protein